MKASLWIAEQTANGRDWRAELKRIRRERRAESKPAPDNANRLAAIEAVGSPELKARLAECRACKEWNGTMCGKYTCHAKWLNDRRRGKCGADRHN